MPQLRTVLAVCVLVLLLSVGATALLSSVQRLHGEVTLDRGVRTMHARPRPRPRPQRPPEPPPPAPPVPLVRDAAAVPDAAPRILYAPAPRYPIEALRDKRQGLVQVRVRLDAGGRVLGASVEKSSGDPELDASALEAVRRWTFSMPPHARRVAVLPIRFHIDGAPQR